MKNYDVLRGSVSGLMGILTLPSLGEIMSEQLKYSLFLDNPQLYPHFDISGTECKIMQDVLIARPDKGLLDQFGTNLKYFTCIGVSDIDPYCQNSYLISAKNHHFNARV